MITRIRKTLNNDLHQLQAVDLRCQKHRSNTIAQGEGQVKVKRDRQVTESSPQSISVYVTRGSVCISHVARVHTSVGGSMQLVSLLTAVFTRIPVLQKTSPAARENFTATKKIAAEVHGAQFAVEMGGMEEKNQRGGLLLTPAGMGAAQENGNANGPWRARFARSLRQIVYSFIAQHGDLKKRVDARLCGRSGIRMTHDLHDTNARRT